ncbi:C-factor [Aplysia californica]|uniref:C-factor n=1 Tax=Aplysia californica TaxID=6500 RepID=A0ABM1A3S0_APLCA|nr:C-factor [Aplysia californica]XP_012940235.1 C-factor [Aplysia californica]XP_012940236.1 C-factor [Aplysia californica]
MAAVCVVQGASRGIGLQFCSALLSRNVCKVIATCRNPSQSEGLLNLKDKHQHSLSVLPLDMTNEADIISAAQEVSNRYGKVDLLINCAGMLHPSGRGETSLKSVSQEGLLETLSTNAVGPLLMAKHFTPLLMKGDGLIGTQSTEKKSQHCAVLVNMSAKVGSIQDNGLGGWYSYRMSKAALNMSTKNLSIELGRGQKKVVCISLHPGTVDTDLSRPYHKNVKTLFTVSHSVDCMLKVVDSLSVSDTGKFYTYDKSLLPF